MARGIWWLVIKAKFRWWNGERGVNFVVIWWLWEVVVMVIYHQKTWWFGDFLPKILVIWWICRGVVMVIWRFIDLCLKSIFRLPVVLFNAKLTSWYPYIKFGWSFFQYKMGNFEVNLVQKGKFFVGDLDHFTWWLVKLKHSWWWWFGLFLGGEMVKIG